jgi:hypothetical protein
MKDEGGNPGTVTLCRIFLAPTSARNDGLKKKQKQIPHP